MLNQNLRDILLTTASDSIKHGLEFGSALSININDAPPQLQPLRASFVTLRIKQELRGCMGTLEAHRPLIADVAHNAFTAAFHDPRFPPLTEQEYPVLSIHISILSTPERLEINNEKELLEILQPGIDGLIIEDGRHRGTFLPSVWESLPDKKEFLRHLKQKAGLPDDYWSSTLKIERYTVEEFG